MLRNKHKIFLLLFIFLICATTGWAKWRMNPHTRKRDYYTDDAVSINGVTVDDSAITTDFILKYDGSQLIYSADTGGGGGGATVFTDLTDTPGSYAGQGGKGVAVKGAEDGVEFVNLGGSPGGADTQVQFNDGGSFGGDAGLVFDKTVKQLIIKAKTGQTTANPLIKLQDSAGSDILAITTNHKSNVLLGIDAGKTITGGLYNVLAGYQAGQSISTQNSNILIGYQTGKSIVAANNVGLGAFAFYNTTTGSSNFALGTNSLFQNTSGPNNVAIGSSAMFANTAGSNNVGIGHNAMRQNKTGGRNVGIGYQVGYGTLNNSYANNVLIGYRAGYVLTTGAENTLLGYRAGDNISSGDANIIIGQNTDAPSATASNQLNIGDTLYGILGSNLSINATTISANYDLLLGGDGVLALKETTTPIADTNYGKVYTKNDNKLYFQDGAGSEHEIAFVIP